MASLKYSLGILFISQTIIKLKILLTNDRVAIKIYSINKIFIVTIQNAN